MTLGSGTKGVRLRQFWAWGCVAASVFFVGVLPVSWGGNAAFAQEVQLAVLQYKGGGDRYSNPTAMPNLVEFCNAELQTGFDAEVPYVEVGSPALFNFPFVHMTGHGNVVFTPSEARNLRTWMEAGGFLHISDNYGMDPYVRKEMEKVFPDLDWVELPFEHPVYHAAFDFEEGLPKVHEHDGEAPRGYGLLLDGRLVCYYDVECDLGDGWEDFAVHRDPEPVRRRALEMGANLVSFALSGGRDD